MSRGKPAPVLEDVARWSFLRYDAALAGGIEEALQKAKIAFEAEEGHLRCGATPTDVKDAILLYKLPKEGWKSTWV